MGGTRLTRTCRARARGVRSHPVMSGFTSGAAIIIGLSQLKDWLGFRVPQSPYIYRTLGHILTNLDKTNGASLGLGIAFFVVLYAMRWAAGKYKALAFLRAAGARRTRPARPARRAASPGRRQPVREG